jgi:VanZ family protein
LRPTHFRLALIFYCIALFGATHIPLRGEVRRVVGKHDKAIHLAAYFGLAVLCGLSAPKWAAWAIALPAYAVVDELLQIPVGRNASAADWAADVAGIALGLNSAFWMSKLIAAVARTRHASQTDIRPGPSA